MDSGFIFFFFLVNANRVRGFESELKATTRGYTERYTGRRHWGPARELEAERARRGWGWGVHTQC